MIFICCHLSISINFKCLYLHCYLLVIYIYIFQVLNICRLNIHIYITKCLYFNWTNMCWSYKLKILYSRNWAPKFEPFSVKFANNIFIQFHKKIGTKFYTIVTFRCCCCQWRSQDFNSVGSHKYFEWQFTWSFFFH
jgi:hypothetical protein